jgi:poly(A) polymerase
VRFIGDPLKRIAEDHLRILRYFRFHARFGSGEPDSAALDACTKRANDLMALSRERIADELLKLLALTDPSVTVGIMLDRGILKPVLPEIDADRLQDLQNLIGAEEKAGVSPRGLRRLAALLPRDPEVATAVAARLKVSNKARKRLSCAAGSAIGADPQALAYRLGNDCAVDRLLLAGKAAEAATIAKWHPPKLPISGGALIERGLSEGPIVARTLRDIEDRWVAAGFAQGEQFEAIVASALADAQR